MKINVLIEKGLDGTYDVHFDPQETNNLSFGLLGQGDTVEEAIADFNDSYEEIKEMHPDTPALEFVFKYDVPSFLAYYSNIISLAGLSRLTGINQGQLSHYVTGRRKPSQKTVAKIEADLHQFASELSNLHFV